MLIRRIHAALLAIIALALRSGCAVQAPRYQPAGRDVDALLLLWGDADFQAALK